ARHIPRPSDLRLTESGEFINVGLSLRIPPCLPCRMRYNARAGREIQGGRDVQQYRAGGGHRVGFLFCLGKPDRKPDTRGDCVSDGPARCGTAERRQGSSERAELRFSGQDDLPARAGESPGPGTATSEQDLKTKPSYI